jgi:hypothetical protein
MTTAFAIGSEATRPHACTNPASSSTALRGTGWRAAMDTLQFRELVEIKFKTFHTNSLEEKGPRWVIGQVVDCSSDAWPLVQLSDGQITELRPYMEWRRLSSSPANDM